MEARMPPQHRPASFQVVAGGYDRPATRSGCVARSSGGSMAAPQIGVFLAVGGPSVVPSYLNQTTGPQPARLWAIRATYLQARSNMPQTGGVASRLCVAKLDCCVGLENLASRAPSPYRRHRGFAQRPTRGSSSCRIDLDATGRLLGICLLCRSIEESTRGLELRVRAEVLCGCGAR